MKYGKERQGEQGQMEAEISKTRELLGWGPRVDCAEGMARTARWAEEVKSDLL